MIFKYRNTLGDHTTFEAAFAVKEENTYLDNPIAVRVVINAKEKKIYWENCAKGTLFQYSHCDFDKDFISFKSKDDKKYKLVYLTKKIFGEIEDSLVPLEKGFKDDQELQKYYLETCFY